MMHRIAWTLLGAFGLAGWIMLGLLIYALTLPEPAIYLEY